jgi:nucleoside-diphosphate-sugar epimerase
VTTPFTVFGANGFIGGAVSARLEAQGVPVRRLTRANWPEAGEALGHVIFTIGMTAGFRTRLAQTVEAQVVRLHEALTRYRFESFLYLSSTRVYAGADTTEEEAPLRVRPADPDQIYNISKLAGEALCFAQASASVRVARLSNVYGAQEPPNTFLAQVLAEAKATGRVRIGQAPQSAKDYVALDDVVERLIGIATGGRHRLYNVGSGHNTRHAEIAGWLTDVGVQVEFTPDAPTASFPPLDCRRANAEFGEPKGRLDSHLRAALG